MINLYVICCKERKKFMEEDKYKTLDSLRDTRGFLNSIKGYETDVELDTRAVIALLRIQNLLKELKRL